MIGRKYCFMYNDRETREVTQAATIGQKKVYTDCPC